MATAATRFCGRRDAASRPPLDVQALDERCGDDRFSRVASVKGAANSSNQVLSVGKHRGRSTVDVHVRAQLLQVRDGA